MDNIRLAEYPADTRPYLKEIAERLWAKHAAVMIGSGFSRNADKNDHTKPDFPTWPGLGDLLYEKLHGQADKWFFPLGNPAHRRPTQHQATSGTGQGPVPDQGSAWIPCTD